MAAASRPKTRSVTDHWMVGQENSLLPIGILPTKRDILKEVLFKRNLPENKSIDQMSLVSCKFSNFESRCYDEKAGGCSNHSDDLKCTVFKIKWRYKEAGVETQSDRSIAKKVLEIYNLYRAIKKKKSQTSKGAVKSRSEFETSLDSLFDVCREDAEELIRSDSSRSKQRKEEDIAFLQDQRSDRKQGMGSTDQRHVKILKNKEQREERKEAQLKKERQRVEQETDFAFLDMSVESSGAGVNTTNTDKSMESLKEQILPSSSRKRRRTRSGEARLIALQVPENILEQTQQIATAKGISPESHLDLIAAFITASGGNLDDFKLSRTTGYRTREWLSQDVKQWRGPGHDRFVQFVRGVDVVNDSSERTVKLCQDFLTTTTKESKLQKTYQVVHRVRRLRRRTIKKDKSSLKLIPTGVK